MSENFDPNRPLVDQLLEIRLQEPCPECDQTGEVIERGRHDTHCYKCDGAGFVPTRWGKRILALVENNFGAMMRRHEERP